ncbi:MAG: Ig-like domain-containing protein, partial [Gammaproteobacteria bacterium]
MLRIALPVFAGLLFSATSAFASVIQVAPGDVTVNDTAQCSLIDAINAANASQSSNVTVGACAPTGTPNGGGDGYTNGNVIVLAAGTYTLTSVYNPPSSGYTNAILFTAADGYWYGPDGLPPIGSNIVIVGDPNGSTIARSSVSGTPAFRLFYVGSGKTLANDNPPAGITGNKLPGPGSLMLVNLTLSNGLAQGGSGTNNSGGGLGAGGAIYNQGTLTLTGDTLTQNQANGGAGSPGFGNGGGGGMGGNGTAGTSTAGGNGGNGGGFSPLGPWPSSAAGYGTFGNGGQGNSTGGNGGGVGGGGGGGNDGFSNGPIGSYGGGAGMNDGSAGGFGGGSSCYGGNGGCALSVFGGGYDPSNNYLTGEGGGGAGLGGAVFNEEGTVTVLNSTLAVNGAHGGILPSDPTANGSGYGGALFNLNGTVTVSYSTLADNSVSGQTALGGAVYNLYFDADTLGQLPKYDGSIERYPSALMTLDSSILAGSTNGSIAVSDCENNDDEGFTSQIGSTATVTTGNNVVQTPGSCTLNNNDQTGIPQLGPLANNGGPTQTMGIPVTSIAVSHGNLADMPAADQRGYQRDSLPDVGAFEYNAPAVAVTTPASVTITEGDLIVPQSFTLFGVGPLTVTGSSSNTALLPNTGISANAGCGNNAVRYQCQLTLTSAAGQIGIATVTLMVSDGFGHTNQTNFQLTVNPAPPPVAVNLTLSAYENTAISGTLAASDAGGNPLNFSVVSAAAHGTVTITNPATGAFTYAPSPGYSGPDSFTYMATDTVTTRVSNTATVTIAVNPVPPPVVGDMSLTVYVSSTLTGTLSASDAAGNPLSFAVVTPPTNGRLTITNAGTGAFTYQETNSTASGDSFTFRVTDTKSGLTSNTATVTITVNPVPVQYAAPVASGESLTTYAGQTLSGQLSAVASNGHALTYTAVAQPAHGTLTLTASSGAFTYTPTSGFTGSDSFTF